MQMLDEYAEAAIQRLLTEHPDLGEQGITLTRREHRLVLSGEVESPARAEHIRALVQQAVPDVVLDEPRVRQLEERRAGLCVLVRKRLRLGGDAGVDAYHMSVRRPALRDAAGAGVRRARRAHPLRADRRDAGGRAAGDLPVPRL